MISSRRSWYDIRSRRLWSNRCQTRSTPAIVTAMTLVMVSSTTSDSIIIAPSTCASAVAAPIIRSRSRER